MDGEVKDRYAKCLQQNQVGTELMMKRGAPEMSLRRVVKTMSFMSGPY